MAEEKEQEDPFASVLKFCHPTASQLAKFQNCPLDRESENFEEPEPDPFSRSSDSAPSEPSGIVMVSLSESDDSVEQQVEDHAVFHTPPEQHLHSNLSSSEDQNSDELCAEGARAVGLGDGSDRSKKVRGFEGGSGDESESKKIRVPDEEFDGETVPIGTTEEVVAEIEGTEAVGDTEVIALDSGDDGEETTAVNLDEDSQGIIDGARIEVGKIDGVQEIGGLMKDCVPATDSIDENHEMGRKRESTVNLKESKGEKPNESSGLSGSLDRGKTKDEIFKLKCLVGNASGKVDKVTDNQKMSKDGYGDGGLRSAGKRIEDVDEFRFAGWDDVGRRWKARTTGAIDPSGKRRQLPPSMKGTEKTKGGRNVVKTVESNGGLLDCLDVLKFIVGDMDDGFEDLDFLETAKRRGMTFPRPRWWPPEGDDE